MCTEPICEWRSCRRAHRDATMTNMQVSARENFCIDWNEKDIHIFFRCNKQVSSVQLTNSIFSTFVNRQAIEMRTFFSKSSGFPFTMRLSIIRIRSSYSHRKMILSIPWIHRSPRHGPRTFTCAPSSRVSTFDHSSYSRHSPRARTRPPRL